MDDGDVIRAVLLVVLLLVLLMVLMMLLPPLLLGKRVEFGMVVSGVVIAGGMISVYMPSRSADSA